MFASPAQKKTYYLFVYNVVQLLGWAAMLQRAVVAWARGGPLAAWPAAGTLFVAMQTSASALELLHVALGLVRAEMTSTAAQAFIRLTIALVLLGGPFNVIHGACRTAQLALFHWAGSPVGLDAGTLLVALGATEVVRYLFFSLRLLLGMSGGRPGPLLLHRSYLGVRWLRYSTFVVFYPLGGACEMYLAAAAIPTVGAAMSKSGRTLQHQAGLSAQLAFLALFLLSNVYLLPLLFARLLTQRSAVLGRRDL